MLTGTGIFGLRSRWNRAEQAKTQGQENASSAVGEKAEAADADETLGKQVQQETAQELVCRKSHGTAYVAVHPVSPEEGDIPVRKRNQAMIGDGYPVYLAAEIAQNILRADEGSLAVGDPFVAEELTYEGMEHFRVREVAELSVEAEQSSCVFVGFGL